MSGIMSNVNASPDVMAQDYGAKNTYDSEEVKRLKERADGYNSAMRASKKIGNTELGKDDFLRLLIVQLRNQDPTKPMEDKEFIAQMAQFSSLEQSKNMADQLTKFNENYTKAGDRNNALSFLGKKVDILRENGSRESGRVDSVDLSSGNLVVNGRSVAVASVISVSDPVTQTNAATAYNAGQPVSAPPVGVASTKSIAQASNDASIQ